jgi:cobalt-zinc-cadmium resistance protein CzcA
MDKQLSKIPGILYNYSQPIRDNVEEAVAGVPASLAVKISGKDFTKLDTLANEVMAQLRPGKGCGRPGCAKESWSA